MHSLASSPTNMHYINTLHYGNPTKTYTQSGIGTVTLKLRKASETLKSFKKLPPTKTYP